MTREASVSAQEPVLFQRLPLGARFRYLVSRQASKAGYLKRKTYRQFLHDATLDGKDVWVVLET